ncbi:terminase large subunit [Mycolicibacterium neoaurum]|uniref:terminase TerL endonuclease subunit n=1 Tax=Mycolicibacterium neoaurum TaxID=1795 RepID=UPI00248D08D5|nr:terminase TerL endonuclease subunit [Mycolicibacterium neoaurum]WBP93865.1 terminase large subunit [Mycolicibacterium neoaurum]WBS07658.1 terminase large subunit [Mycolicibacterium neoaurum]
MKAGPKAAVDPAPLPWRPRSTGSARFAAFCLKFIKVPSGTGALKPLKLRPWQIDLVGSVLNAPVQPRTAGWMLPRGQGKSSLMAAWGLYELFEGGEAATICVVAVDERQAGIIFNIARRMVELDEHLARRVVVYKERLEIPSRGAEFHVLPAEPKRLEGLNYSLAVLDEAGVANRDSYEVLTLAQGKRLRSTLVCIGTPGPKLDDQVLLDLRRSAAENPEDKSLVWREFSAAGFEDHPVSCAHCWELANPALDDFLHRDAMTALLPPKTREATFRRARLCQLASDAEGRFLDPRVWDDLSTGRPVPDGADVVIALDGSFSDDTTALLVGTVSPTPHFDTVRVWERPHRGDTDYRVPIAEVEDVIRASCRRWRVMEIIADPFRWTRTLQALESERLPVVEFPHSPSRLTAATTDLYSAAVNGRMSHSGEAKLAAHVGGAVIVEDARGMRLSKQSRSATAPKIDLAACLVMAHSRATWRATHRNRRKARSFA